MTDETDRDVPSPYPYICDLDEDGVLTIKIPYTEEWGYYSLFIARYALSNLKKYRKTGDEEYEEVFLTQVDFLCDDLVEKDGFAVWENDYSLPWYDFDEKPWVLGLGQGIGMRALIEAHEHTGESHYLKKAKKVLHSFDAEIEDGGVKYVDEEGYTWFEEYAIDPPPHVLNGFITILQSIDEFYDYTEEKKAEQLWEEGIKTIKDNLDRYDNGYWSLYDLHTFYPSTVKYHKMHVRQLKELYEDTGEKIFLNYAEKWEDYKDKRLNRVRKSLKRGFIHLRTKGVIGGLKRYHKLRKYRKKGN